MSTWREIKGDDVVADGDRIMDPYGEELTILKTDGYSVDFDDGDTWNVASMADAREWMILKLTCAECGQEAKIFGDELCRDCWISVVVQYGGNPIMAFLPDPSDGVKENG